MRGESFRHTMPLFYRIQIVSQALLLERLKKENEINLGNHFFETSLCSAIMRGL